MEPDFTGFRPSRSECSGRNLSPFTRRAVRSVNPGADLFGGRRVVRFGSGFDRCRFVGVRPARDQLQPHRQGRHLSGLLLPAGKFLLGARPARRRERARP